MECPRPQDFLAARQRLSQATAAWEPGTITIQGNEVSGSVKVGAETFDLGERGPMKVQTFEARISKTLVAATPKQGDIVVINELGYKITRVEGFMAYEIDWVLTGSRTPGKDT